MTQDAPTARRRKTGERAAISVNAIAVWSPTWWLIWFTLFMLWAIAVASLVSFDPADAPGHAVAPHNTSTANWIGSAGATFAYQAFSMLGVGAWLLVTCAAGLLAWSAWMGKSVSQFAVRAAGVLVIAIALGAMHALIAPSWTKAPEGAGGLAGGVLAHALSARFGVLGASMWVLLMAAVGATVAFDRWLLAVPIIAWRLVRAGSVKAGVAIASGAVGTGQFVKEMAADMFSRDEEHELEQKQVFMRKAVQRQQKAAAARAGEPAEAEVEFKSHKKEKAAVAVAVEDDAGPIAPGLEENDWAGDDQEADEDDPASAYEEDDAYRELSDDEIDEKIEALPVFFAGANKGTAGEEDLEALRAERSSEEEVDRNYLFPGLDLLEDPDEDFDEKLESYVREQARALEHAMQQYRIKGEVVGIESGPVITLYQVRLAPGTKVSSITSVDKDIARSLKAVNIRIVPNTEGRDTVGIEVPNLNKERVRLKELMTADAGTSKMKLPMFLGKDASGQPLITDLAKLPHMLIAGTTGSGKSVCMNTIIMSFLYTQKPTDLKLVLVDPKMVEMSQFKDIPHLLCPVVTEMGKAAAILEWAVTKMDERYELLAEAGCRDITSYNELDWEEKKEALAPTSEYEEAKIPKKLPYMVFVIDELADLMMTNKEVEGSIVRIAQKARAVGIHLILATQRPQANVVTGLIKSNMPGRVSFKVASGMDSRIVLDQKGGELLLGQGDMLMITPRSSTALRAQGTLVDDHEIRKVVRFVKEHSQANFSRDLVSLENHGFGADPASAEAHEEKMRQSAQEDPLFDRAVEIVLETKRGSVSLLQRRLAIGYTRASRLIELMGFCNIIGKHKGSVAREVLMTAEDWEAIKARAEEAASDAEASLFVADEEATETDTDSEEDAQPPYASEPSRQVAPDASANLIGGNGSDLEEDVPFDVDDEDAGVAVHAHRLDEEGDRPAKLATSPTASATPTAIEAEPEAVASDADAKALEEEVPFDVDEGEPEAKAVEAEEAIDDEPAEEEAAAEDDAARAEVEDEAEAEDEEWAEYDEAEDAEGEGAGDEESDEDEYEYEYEYVEFEDAEEEDDEAEEDAAAEVSAEEDDSEEDPDAEASSESDEDEPENEAEWEEYDEADLDDEDADEYEYEDELEEDELKEDELKEDQREADESPKAAGGKA